MLEYNPNYFMNSMPDIYDNKELREPQINAYDSVYNHFIRDGKNTHAVVVLPTGVGKTGLMGILPYHISKGRVLIITPQIVIKDTVLDSLDPDYPGNFWMTRKVFETISELPCMIEYEGAITRKEWLEAASIVVLNIHKLQSRLSSSLTNIVPPDFFDMIIIDEAHHSTAKTWVDAINYFCNAKVVKLTGTPFRSDNEKIVGEEVYKYKLSMAMAHNYVKSLEHFQYVPDELYLTIENDESKQFTVEQLYEMGIRDEDWVSRSVAFSYSCNKSIVVESIKMLEEKLSNNNPVPHKIIAVACSIPHAKQVKEIYEELGYPSAIIHSGMEQNAKEAALKDIENHRVKVVINVAMLGEGYDHPYLSVAAIFRPFRNLLPYAQFIGRILRVIPPQEAQRPTDNIGQVISHFHMNLEELWKFYKTEIQESETIKYLEEQPEVEINPGGNDTDGEGRGYDTSIGAASESTKGKLLGETYLDTELIKQRNIEFEIQKQKIKDLQDLLNISEQEAKRIYNQTQGIDNQIKRPDQYFKKSGKNIDVRIREEIVPELISRFNIDKAGNNLRYCRLFSLPRYRWIPESVSNNAGMLATYFNTALVDKIGCKKEFWKPSDFEIAAQKVEEILEFVLQVLKDYTKRK